MTIKVADVIQLTQYHLHAISRIRPNGQLTDDDKTRWALLVTVEEMIELVDEMLTLPEYKDALTPEHAEKIKVGRAMLHVNFIPILPELILVPSSGPN